MCSIRNILLSSCLVLAFLFIPSICVADNGKSVAYYSNPQLIIKEVSNRGVHIVVEELFEYDEAWDFILEQIATGSDDWLQVAIVLSPGTDAHAAESLISALGEALKIAPKEVLMLALKDNDIGIEDVCSGPDIDDFRYGTYELALKEIEKRQKRVSSISNGEIEILKNECYQNLENAKRHVARFFGVR